jgi:hypothetical protein
MTDYAFNNMGRIGLDESDQSQRAMQNTRFANYMLAGTFSHNPSTIHADTVTFSPTVTTTGMATGHGLHGDLVDHESVLKLRVDQDRPFEKLSLAPRSFLTVPYLGKGSCDPDTESRLLQGELVTEKKSVGTVMDKSFLPYVMPPSSQSVRNHALFPVHAGPQIEEVALQGWVRGGSNTRE